MYSTEKRYFIKQCHFRKITSLVLRKKKDGCGISDTNNVVSPRSVKCTYSPGLGLL